MPKSGQRKVPIPGWLGLVGGHGVAQHLCLRSSLLSGQPGQALGLIIIEVDAGLTHAGHQYGASRRAVPRPSPGFAASPRRPRHAALIRPLRAPSPFQQPRCRAPAPRRRAPAPPVTGPTVPGGSGIAVSKPLRGTCATGARLAALAPASTPPGGHERRAVPARVHGARVAPAAALERERWAVRGRARPREAEVAVGLACWRGSARRTASWPSGPNSEKYGSWPQPTNQSPLASACTLPWLSATRRRSVRQPRHERGGVGAGRRGSTTIAARLAVHRRARRRCRRC